MTSMSHANSTTPVPFFRRKHGMRIRRFVLKLLHLCVPSQDAQEFGHYDDGVDSDSRDNLRPSGGGDWHEARVRPVRGRRVNDSCELYRKKSGRRTNDEHEVNISGNKEGKGSKHVAFLETEVPPVPSSHYGETLRPQPVDVVAFVLTQVGSTIGVKSHWSDSSTPSTSSTLLGLESAAPAAPPTLPLYQGPQNQHHKHCSTQQPPLSAARKASTQRSRAHHTQAPLRPHLSPSQRVAPPSPTPSPQSRVEERFRLFTQSARARQLISGKVIAMEANTSHNDKKDSKDQHESVPITWEQTQDPPPVFSAEAHTPDGSPSDADVLVMWRTSAGEGEEVRIMKDLMGEISVTVSSSSSSDEEVLPPVPTSAAEQQSSNVDDDPGESSNWELLSSRSPTPATPSDLAIPPILHSRRPELLKPDLHSPTKTPRPRRSPRKVPASPCPGEDYDAPVLRSIAFAQTADGKDMLGHVDAGYAAYLGCQTEVRSNMTLFDVRGPTVRWRVCESRNAELRAMAEAARSIMRTDGKQVGSLRSRKSAKSLRAEKGKKDGDCGFL